ncbi:MAG: hypothetical protein KDD66_14070 [Bdellovibrionales bacterium]|nr:hypothetical protein [Bdellovibrionales bacterium]
MSDSPQVQYQDVRFSLPIVLLTFGLSVWSFYTAAFTDDRLTLALNIILGIVCALILLNYFAVMVTIDPFTLSWHYGFGLAGNSVDRRYIEGAFIGRNNHFSSWIFSPFNPKCVVAVTREGQKIYLPCSDPLELANVLSGR